MKSLIFFTLITALVASTARADREGRALVGGLIGGIIIDSILDDDRHLHHHHTRIHHRSRGYDRHGGCGYNGHYDYISVKTWINGHWSVSYDRYGHCHLHWCPGYYSYDKRRGGYRIIGAAVISVPNGTIITMITTGGALSTSLN